MNTQNTTLNIRGIIWRATAAVLLLLGLVALTACGGSGDTGAQSETPERYLNIIDDEPDTMDPQCTSGNYTVPLNIYDRLVEVKSHEEDSEIVPSLASSWEISEDGRMYTFHLHENVTFSNGSPLTSEDVGYTFKRLLTYENSCNGDLVKNILGAESLRAGKSRALRGFNAIDDYTFTIELEHPYAAFLACLATPGASILDRESTAKAGSEFGLEPDTTIGTGPFIVESWEPGEKILLKANPDCWSGAPGCSGVSMFFDTGEFSHIDKFNNGELDILDLEYLDTDAEYFARGNIYLENIVRANRVGISYITFNQSIAPLDRTEVRRALQLGLDRKLLLKAILSGRGRLENGIIPYGLAGYDPKQEEIPYDPREARRLLAEAGYPEGFKLEITCLDTDSSSQRELIDLVAFMWGEIGVDVSIRAIPEDKFYELRGAGKLECYTGTWSADYDDPSNFFNTFFGSEENTNGRSLCYPNRDIMKRVQRAERIVDEGERTREYQLLEKIIVQDEASWIPLYSRQHLFVISDRVDGFTVLWNGWSSNSYRNVTVQDDR